MTRKLTEAEKAAYLADPSKCPYPECGSIGPLTWVNEHFDENGLMADDILKCEKCGSIIKVIYGRVAIEEVE